MQSIRPIIESWKSGIIPKTIDTELCSIYRRCGSDKKTDTFHNYTNLYYNLFLPLKHQTFNFFELGLGSHNHSIPWNMSGGTWKVGASMYAAEEFFSTANIYGADIDHDIIFNKGRIKTFFCDARNPRTIKNMWDDPELKDKKFEIIMDDACHEFDANYCFLVNSIQKLAPQGIFIIEDLGDYSLPQFTEKASSITADFNLEVYELLPMRGATLLLIQVK